METAISSVPLASSLSSCPFQSLLDHRHNIIIGLGGGGGGGEAPRGSPLKFFGSCIGAWSGLVILIAMLPISIYTKLYYLLSVFKMASLGSDLAISYTTSTKRFGDMEMFCI